MTKKDIINGIEKYGSKISDWADRHPNLAWGLYFTGMGVSTLTGAYIGKQLPLHDEKAWLNIGGIGGVSYFSTVFAAVNIHDRLKKKSTQKGLNTL